MPGARPRFRLYALAAALSAAPVVATGVATGVAVPALDVASGDARISIGSVRTNLNLLGAALAQSPDEVTLDNLTLEVGGTTYRIPRIDFTGVSLSRADLMSLFAAGAGEPIASRLAKLSARRVVVPELTVEDLAGGERQVRRYRNLVASGVAGGRIASLTGEGGTVQGGNPWASGRFGPMAVEGFDLAEAARLYTEKASASPPEMTRIYDSFSMEDLTLSDPQGAEVRIARLSGRDLSARPTKDSWAETERLAGALDPTGRDRSPEKALSFAALLELLDSFRIGSVEATGFEMRDLHAAEPAGGRIARIAYTAAASGKPAEARLEGVAISAESGRIRIGAVSFSGFSFQSTIAALRALGDKPLSSLDWAELRRIVPTLGTVRISGFSFDGPGKAEPSGGEPRFDRIRLTVREMEAAADKPLNGLPTDLRFAIGGLSLPVPADTAEESLKDLAALGYGSLDLSFLAAASWNEPGNELLVRELSLEGAHMGRIVVRGTLGNVSKDVFDPDPALALVSLVGATARSADLTVENTGLFEKVLAREAERQGKSPDQLRREYGMAAAIAIPAVLGGSPQAKSLGQATARFIARPGRLAIAARAKTPPGLGLADLASLSDAPAVLDKLEITASAE